MSKSILDQRLDFLREIDKLKSVVRASPLINNSRKENSAEHSWHLAMYALVLSEHSTAKVDLARVILMLLLHDIVEIDAGDTPIHGQDGPTDQMQKELQAAERIFGLLPTSQGEEFRTIWLEFEAAETEEARFAKSLDRLQPFVHNVASGGGTWVDHNVSHQQVLERYGPTIEAGSAELWNRAENLAENHFENDE